MESSRGQIVLIAALGIAVTLVALAVIVNTVIFTENLATRETVQGDDAVALERTVEESAGTLLGLSNRDNRTDGDYDAHVSSYRYDIETLSHGNALQSASSGHVAAAELVSVHNGTWIIQDADSRSFSDDQNDSTWTVAADVTDTRRFVLTVTDVGTDPFVVTVSNESTDWEMEIDGPTPYTVTTTIDGETESCSADTDNLTVGLTTGEVNGTACSAVDFERDVDGPYSITFDNATSTNGTYYLAVDREMAALRTDLPEDNYDNSTVDPRLRTALYNATVSVTIQQPDVYYSTNVTVEPEGPPIR